MEREPTLTTDDLAIEVAGKTHHGRRIVLRVSDTEIRQEIRFKSLRQVDPDSYQLAEADFMRSIAREMLWRLVTQWMAGGVRRPTMEVPRQGHVKGRDG